MESETYFKLHVLILRKENKLIAEQKKFGFEKPSLTVACFTIHLNTKRRDMSVLSPEGLSTSIKNPSEAISLLK